MNPAIAKLRRKATQAELEVVDTLAIACGYLWRCRVKSCQHVNDGDDSFCGRCHTARPR